jgi:CRP-like cAMP-binding protein
MRSTPKQRDSGNDLLDRLPADEFHALQPKLQRTSLTIKQLVHQAGTDLAHVYFPRRSLISLLTVLRDDDPVEAATVGREGFVGLAVSLGIAASPFRAICQMTGDSLRLPVRTFMEAMTRGPGLAHLLHRYAAFSLRAAGQSIACNSLHTVEARACRWLLKMHDQAAGDEFAVTQEFDEQCPPADTRRLRIRVD